MGTGTILENVERISDRFAGERSERQLRRALDPRDFDALREAGFQRAALPESEGGLWRGLARSTRPLCEMLRTLARGDASVALVASMHPTVLMPWLGADAAAPDRENWRRQREEVLQSVLDGAWWGTLKSEPGSGGDIRKTRTTARRGTGGQWRLHGDKHFGSGSGITAFMVTTAIPEGEPEPDVFVLDMRGVPWDGSTGAKLVAEWDGHGMIATQSHAFRLDDCPARRIAWSGNAARWAESSAILDACTWSAVVVGVVQAAREEARRRLAPRRDELRAQQRVEWTRACNEAWLVEQAYQGMLRSVESGGNAAVASLHAKTAVAELSEALLTRLCRVIGGSSLSRSEPFGAWAQDARALGFLRPPWPLAFDELYASSWGD
jgi:alkylation response protein AidB-like acyl-CoA dehydrogenase